MKKCYALILAVVMLVSLFGCSNGSTSVETTAPSTGTTTEPTTEPTTAPTTEPTTAPTTEPTTEATTESTVEPTTEPTETQHAHSYTESVTAPTCESGGYTTYTCDCGEYYVSDQTNAMGHDYKSKVIAPTQTSEGYTEYTCTRCGKSYRDNYTDRLPPAHEHKYNAVVTKPTCTTGGYTTYTCSCGDSYVDDETVAVGHNYEREVIAPTTESEGYTLHTCKTCGDSYKDNYTDKLPAPTEHEHSYTMSYTEPTCTEEGYETYTCACGDSYKGKTDAAIGHSMVYWGIKDPTPEVDGYKIYKCETCGYEEKETLHQHSWGNWQSDNYGSTGTCATCGENQVLDGSGSYAVTEVVDLINQYRVAEGLAPLEYYWAGQECANIRAAEITVYFSHMRPDGSYPNNIWSTYSVGGECIAATAGGASSAVELWMNSSGHRPSLMDEYFTCATVACNGNCWVVLFFY